MTSVTINTLPANASAMFTMPQTKSRSNQRENLGLFTTYLTVEKTSLKHIAEKFLCVDWDLNMNELEFE